MEQSYIVTVRGAVRRFNQLSRRSACQELCGAFAKLFAVSLVKLPQNCHCCLNYSRIFAYTYCTRSSRVVDIIENKSIKYTVPI